MLLQTAAVIVILGFANDRVPLKLFMLRMMLAGLVTFVFFVAMPAEGTPNQYGLTPTPLQASFLEHLHALRSGLLRHFDFGRVEGFIAFPSFHAIWAMLIVVACWHRRGVCEHSSRRLMPSCSFRLSPPADIICATCWGGAVIAVAVCLRHAGPQISVRAARPIPRCVQCCQRERQPDRVAVGAGLPVDGNRRHTFL